MICKSDDEIPAGMKPWHGGDAAPADWDRGRVLLRDGGYLTEEKNGCPFYWTHADDLDGFKEAGDIIAYTPKPPAGSRVSGEDK